ncbi:MAG: hypothetical protein L0H55_17000, partial [Candidatus Nitrosocosmicus sp.]|nr:hypothetical protein [Candidatus Nitrosocosmicus sp.]
MRTSMTMMHSITFLVSLMLITTAVVELNPVNAFSSRDVDWAQRAPIATSGDNVYIAWMSDKGTLNSNAEIIFRASNDGGQIFGEKINLSNSSEIDSVDQMITAEGDSVFVTWWERNATSNTPVLRVSN